MLAPALCTLLGASSVLAAPAIRQNAAKCSADNQNYIDNLTCPTLSNLGAVLNFQADNLGTRVDSIVPELNSLLTSDDPVSAIVKDLTGGIVQGLSLGPIYTLKNSAATLGEISPDCKCNMVACNNLLLDAKGQCALGNENPNVQAACGYAIYSCAQFYTMNQLDAMTGCCAAYASALE